MVYHFAVADFEPEADRVAEVLRGEIIEGQRRPGSRLVERDLAAELGVSRVPVREALRNLVGEGLATPRPRTWAVVREFTPSDVEALMEVRSALETLAIRLAAQRRKPAQVERLFALVERSRMAAERGDALTAHRAGADFHDGLTEMAGNSVLVELAAITRSRMRWLLGQHDDLQEMVSEHAAILSAIAAGDVEQAVALAESHLVSSRRAVSAREPSVRRSPT